MTDVFGDQPDETQGGGMPHNREAEEAVVGTILIDPLLFPDLFETVKAEKFYIHRLRFIWEAFERLYERKAPIDILTATSELDDFGRLDEIGGPAFLTALLNQVPTTLNVDEYASIICKKHVRRELLKAANKIAGLAYDETVDAEDAASEAAAAVETASEGTVQQTFELGKEVFSRVYDQADALSKLPKDQLPGVKTGLFDLDKMLGGGMQKPDLICLAGRPGEGKTALALTIIHEACYVNRKKTALFTLEMSNDQMARRLVSMDAGIDGQTVSTGKIHEQEWGEFTNSIENLSFMPLAMDETVGITPTQMRLKLRRMKAALGGLDLIVLDYLGLMESDKYTDNRVQEIGHISRSLKKLAREFKVPILALHQMSREMEKRAVREPVLSDLRDSGSVEQDSDIVMFIYRDQQSATGNISHLKVAKHRNGPIGTIDLVFRANLTKFESAVSRNVEMIDYIP